MNIKQLEKSFFEGRVPPKDLVALKRWEEINKIMTKYYDKQKLNAINLATDQLVNQAIKNGIIFNRVNGLEANANTISAKKVVYSDYKRFIEKICALPEIEREFLMLNLNKNCIKCKRKFAMYTAILDFESAKKYKIIGGALKTAMRSIEGKNRFLELVK